MRRFKNMRVREVARKRRNKKGEKGNKKGWIKEKKREDRGSVSGDVLFKEVSPCLMSLV